MPAGGENIVAGSYTATWNGGALGLFEADPGTTVIEMQPQAELVQSTSTYGKTPVDGVYQGGAVYASYTCLAWSGAVTTAMWPFGALGLMGIIGRLLFGMSAPLVLTAVAGTPAGAGGNISTLTAANAILAPGFNTRILMGPTLRKMPIRQLLFPFSSSGSIVWFTTT